jgi:uncharacterized SAM-binding protein YcdF (DUF218 family)
MLLWLKRFVSYWMMPLPLGVALLLAGTVLLFRPRFARLGRALVVAGVLLLAVLGNKTVSRALIRPLETRYAPIPELVAGGALPADLARCRYVFVLGAGNCYTPGAAPTALLSTSALARTVEAVRLLRALPEARLVVSGPQDDDGRASHASVLAAAARSLGVPAERILKIDTARDTEDEANAVRRIVGDAPVAIVTSAAHLPRAMALCRHAGLRAVPCPADYRSHADDPFRFMDLFWELESLERSTWAVRERIGYLWIWLRGKT